MTSDAAVPLFFVAIMLVLAVISLVGLAFWVWTIIDCATKESNEGNTKVVWLIVIILTSWLGALIYVLVRRPQRQRERGQ